VPIRRSKLVLVPLFLALAVTDGLAARIPRIARQEVLPDTNALPPEMVNDGRRIFHGKGTCFACHGAHLEGGPIAPTLKPHAWKDAKGGDLSAIHYVVTHGVSGTPMVSHPGGISDAEAIRVAVYIWAVGHRGATP
jgi:Cytochrome c, mono- and diheme variants